MKRRKKRRKITKKLKPYTGPLGNPTFVRDKKTGEIRLIDSSGKRILLEELKDYP